MQIIKKTSDIVNYPQNSDFLTFTGFLKNTSFFDFFKRSQKAILHTTF
jgi:hypothetical protein